MSLLAIPNLSSSAVTEINPWEFEPNVPARVRGSKAEFVKHCQKPSTKHCHFSAVEGLDPLRRVGEDNPVVFLRGIVADFDATCTQDMFEAVVEHAPTEFPPNWGSTTFSGGARLVWLFNEPLPISDSALCKSFLKVAKRKLKVSSYFPGLDEEAFSNSSKYYERGANWRMLGGDKIPQNMLWQWLYETGNKRKWKNKNEIMIPIKEVAIEVEKQFPRKWKGEFEEGVRGNRFWDEMATNTTSAVIRATGMQCFSGDVGFMSWSELLGPKFVEQYKANTTGAIVNEFYYDGTNYWQQDATKLWRSMSKEDLKLSLKVKFNLSNYPAKGETSSECDQVLFAVQEQKRVHGALPFVHKPQGLLTFDHGRFLNVSSVKCLAPDAREDITDWGDGFPWIASFLTDFFDPAEQLNYLLSWWKHFYQNGLRQTPRTGHALFIAGDTNAGKTLLSTGLISRTVGGHADASAYLLGEDRFTSHVIKSPIMSVDDTMGATDARRHTRYSAMIKKVVANRHQLYEEKFVKAGMVEWLGRIVVTCNLDPESLRLLPNVDISIMDKIMMLRCAQREFEFPGAEEMEATLAQELPAFCRWLLNWKMPKACVGDARFGVKPYHDRHLYNAAIQTSSSYSFLELLVDFLEDYKASKEGNDDYWEGTATKLMTDMRSDDRISTLAAAYSPPQAASLLGQLKTRGFELDKVRSSSKRLWRIPFNLGEQVHE